MWSSTMLAQLYFSIDSNSLHKLQHQFSSKCDLHAKDTQCCHSYTITCSYSEFLHNVKCAHAVCVSSEISSKVCFLLMC